MSGTEARKPCVAAWAGNVIPARRVGKGRARQRESPVRYFGAADIGQRRGRKRTSGVWRKGWDSNPRYPCEYGSFQDCCLQPLGHLSAVFALNAALRAQNWRKNDSLPKRMSCHFKRMGRLVLNFKTGALTARPPFQRSDFNPWQQEESRTAVNKTGCGPNTAPRCVRIEKIGRECRAAGFRPQFYLTANRPC